jgi:hypothetical protein
LLYGIYRLYGVGEANGFGPSWIGNTEVTVPSISATEEKVAPLIDWRINVSLGDLSNKPENAAALMNRFMPNVPLPKDRTINKSIYNSSTKHKYFDIGEKNSSDYPKLNSNKKKDDATNTILNTPPK